MSHNKLTIIPKSEWPKLRDLHLPNWPSNISAYYAIDTYIKWCAINEKVEKSVKFYALNNDWQDGTFLIVVNA